MNPSDRSIQPVRLTKDWSVYNLSVLTSYTDDFSAPTMTARCSLIRRWM